MPAEDGPGLWFASVDGTLEMSAFKHLIVPIGVIIGLGVARIVSAASSYVQHRDRVRFAGSHSLWFVLIFLWFVGLWWIVWSLRHVPEEAWSFWALIFLLVGPALMYLATTLLLPDLPTDGELDLGQRLEDVARPFCLALAGVVAWLAWTEIWLLAESWWVLPKRLSQVGTTALFVAGAVVPSRRVMLGIGCIALPVLLVALSTVRAKLG